MRHPRNNAPKDRRDAARRNKAQSNGSPAIDGNFRSQSATYKHGLYATNNHRLPGESVDEYHDIQAQFHSFWRPAHFYTQLMVEELVGIQWELRRTQAAKNDHVLSELAGVVRANPHITDQAKLNLQAEKNVSVPGGVLHHTNLRICQLHRERHRIERELMQLEKRPSASGPEQMSLIINNRQDSGVPATENAKPVPGTLAEAPYITEAEPGPLPESLRSPAPERVANTAPGDDGAPPDDIVNWAKTALDLHPDSVQAQVMTAANPRILVLAPRQTGKSTAAALRVLYEAAHYNDAVILLASASGRQSGQIMEKARKMARFLDFDILPPPPKCDGFSLANGSQVIALPDNPETIRGFSAPRLIVVDEAAFASEDLFKALDPMLTVSNGTLMLLSTPNGQTGYFYEQWHAAATPWTRIFGTLADCPRVQAEAVEAIRKSMSEADFQQEFECKFIAGSAQFISREIIEQCITEDFELFCPDFKWEYDTKDEDAKVPNS